MLSNVSNHCYLRIFSIILLYHGSTQLKSGLLDNTYKIFFISKIFWENSELDFWHFPKWYVRNSFKHINISNTGTYDHKCNFWSKKYLALSRQQNDMAFLKNIVCEIELPKNASQIIASYSTLPKWRWHNGPNHLVY